MLDFLQHLKHHARSTPSQSGRPRKTLTLDQRKRARSLRTMAIALCVGLAVFFTLQTVVRLVRTRTTVAAARDIARGALIENADLKVLEIPDHAAFASAFTGAEQVTGKIAQIDIKTGDMLTRPMARVSPVPKPGQTVVSVRISSVAKELLPGQSVSLMAVTSCANMAKSAENGYAAPNNAAPNDGFAGAAGFFRTHLTNDTNNAEDGVDGQAPQSSLTTQDPSPPQDPKEGTLCTLAETATVMTGTAKEEDSAGAEDKELTQFAMSPAEAAKVMAVQDHVGIMATVTGK
jgi:hypothetical protein